MTSVKPAYTFDKVFAPAATNLDVFTQSVSEEIEQCLLGFNTTIMLYGVTGSGKTHTVFGSLGYRDQQSAGEHEPGIIYHSMKQLMDVPGVTVSISYVEIYNEQVKDLLGVEDNLMITENGQGEVVIQSVKVKEIETFCRLIEAVKEGNNRRKTAKTNANSFSSRSHAVLQVFLKRKDGQATYTSKISFIDLAGSERVEVTHNKGIIK